MKHQQSQSGSAHVIAIVVLVIALVSALGWIFWQNFIYKNSQATSDETPLAVDKKSSPSDKKQYLIIDEWPIKLPLAEEIDDAVYTFNEERQTVYLSTKSLDSMSLASQGQGCEIVAIWRGKKGDEKFTIPGENTPNAWFGDGDYEVRVGDYFYTSMGGNGFCTDDDEGESRARAAFIDAAKNLVAR